MALVFPEVVGSETQTRLHKNAGSPEPSLITFVISTSPHGFIMLGSSERKDAWALRRRHTRVFAFFSLNSRQEILKLWGFGDFGKMINVSRILIGRAQ